MILRIAFIVLALAGGGLAGAQTLRWSSQGDLQTLDPHSQNELLTNSINGQVYDTLVMRDKKLGLAPGLAVEWTPINPTLWRMKLRPNVKFHDGTPFTADDVLFSIQRAAHPSSPFRTYAVALGTPKKVDDLTVDFQLKEFNPIFLQHATTIYIMSKAWSEKNNASAPLDFKNKDDKFTNLNANGTGPYMLVSRQPDTKTVFKRNPNYWAKFEGNVQEVVYSPIKNDATRTAALISGEIDLVLDPAPQDTARLRNTQGVRVIDGVENRILFIGMDQARDELLYSNVKGKNPFKDIRVRKALYQAIDMETLKRTVMRGQALVTGANTPSPLGTYGDAELEKRFLPYDVAGAKKLLAEAGYPTGFEVQLDCPNNRYINDQPICEALSAMWAKIGLKVNVLAQPRATYFPKAEKLDVSLYMLGWGGAITDAETTLTPVLHSRADNGVGYYNWGNYKNPKLDQLIEASSKEPDAKKREQLVKAALREHQQQVHNLPLHRQVIPWAARTNVEAVHRADNWLEWQWVKVGPSPK
jgi:peptide/nickel transport system substrate-binding protein